MKQQSHRLEIAEPASVGIFTSSEITFPNLVGMLFLRVIDFAEIPEFAIVFIFRDF